MSWFYCDLNVQLLPKHSHVGILRPQLMVLFRKAVKPLVYGIFMGHMSHQEQPLLMLYTLAISLAFSLLHEQRQNVESQYLTPVFMTSQSDVIFSLTQWIIYSCNFKSKQILPTLHLIGMNMFYHSSEKFTNFIISISIFFHYSKVSLWHG